MSSPLRFGSLRSLLFLAGAALCACLGHTRVAEAQQGTGEGIGLVFGYSSEGSWSLGWEASLTRGGPLVKLSAGGIYHIAPLGEDPFTVHYSALEPWLVVGGTLGLAIADGPEPLRLAYGIWEGFPISLEKGVEPFGGQVGEPRIWMLTLTFGWRGFGPTTQIYFTPKLWRFAPIGWNS
jgi:hypothetical protein